MEDAGRGLGEMVGIVILNYENWGDTKRCVESIHKNTHGIAYRIILVDNASTCAPGFGLASFLEKYQIIFLRNKENVGYNAGNNVGIAQALRMGCGHLLICNNDVRFRAGSIQALRDCLDGHPQAGIAGPKVLDRAGRVQRCCICRETGLKEKYLVRTRANALFRKSYRSYFGYDRDYGRMFRAYAVLGCCFMMTARCARAVTPFDEYPVLYEEELMLGMRMQEKGFATLYCPSAAVMHLHGASTAHRKAFAFIHNVRSEVYYCRRYLRAEKWQIYPLYLYRAMLYLLRCARYRDFRRNLRQFFRVAREAFEHPV